MSSHPTYLHFAPGNHDGSIDTSYLFREAYDPSTYDKFKDFFGQDSRWPFAKAIGSGKDTYRIYFFIAPFFLAFLSFAIAQSSKSLLKSSNLPSLTPYLGVASLSRVLRKRAFSGLSLMDVVLIIMTVFYSEILIATRMERSLSQGAKKLTFLYEDDKEPLTTWSWQGLEVLALTFGVLTITLLGWFVLMTMGKQSLLLKVLDIPWEVAIKYHRWLGWYTLFICFLHMALYILVWIHAHGNPKYDPDKKMLHHMMLPRSCNNGSCDEDTNRLHIEMMHGYAAFFLLLIICVTSLNKIRRKFYEVFLYTHQLYRLVILFVCFHYAKTLLYLIPGLSMLLIDNTIRWLARFFTVKAEARLIAPDLFELRVRKDKDTRYEAGQYLYVNCPLVSALEWHPMTVTWATEDYLALHVKTRGEGSWTQQVYDEIKSLTTDKDEIQGHPPCWLPLRLDGFYGPNEIDANNLNKKKAVIMVSGGCGVTFLLSIAREFCSQANQNVPVYLHWVTRSEEEFVAFECLLLEIQRIPRQHTLFISAYVTLRAADNLNNNNNSSNFASATSPNDVALGSSSYESKHAQKISVWQGFPSWLWSPAMYALLNAVAILLATTGYAMAQKNSGSDTLSSEPRYLLVDRFLELFFSVFMVEGLILLAIGIRFLHWKKNIWVLLGQLVGFDNNDHHKDHSSNQISSTYGDDDDDDNNNNNSSSNSRHYRISSDSDDEGISIVENGSSDSNPETSPPMVVEVGKRPDLPGIFQELEDKYQSNVAVFACGPRPLVDAVRTECQSRCMKGFTMCEEEWEW